MSPSGMAEGTGHAGVTEEGRGGAGGRMRTAAPCKPVPLLSRLRVCCCRRGAPEQGGRGGGPRRPGRQGRGCRAQPPSEVRSHPGADPHGEVDPDRGCLWVPGLDTRANSSHLVGTDPPPGTRPLPRAVGMSGCPFLPVLPVSLLRWSLSIPAGLCPSLLSFSLFISPCCPCLFPPFPPSSLPIPPRLPVPPVPVPAPSLPLSLLVFILPVPPCPCPVPPLSSVPALSSVASPSLPVPLPAAAPMRRGR